MGLSIASLMAYFFGALAFTADIIAVASYIKSVKLGQYRDTTIKVILIFAIFFIGVSLIYIGKTPDSVNHTYILKFFSWLYFLLSFMTLFLASYVLKGAKRSSKEYLAFASSSLIIYLLGVVLLFLTGDYIPALAYLFFSCTIAQCFYWAGEYGIKRVLEGEDIEIKRYFLSEYPHFINLLIKDVKGLKSIFSAKKNDVLPNNEISNDNVELGAMSYKHLSLDLMLLAYTFILGVGLLLLNNQKFHVFNWLG